MSAWAEVDQRDIKRLQSMFTDLEKYTRTNVAKVMRQTMRFALQSAATVTKPRKSKGKDGRRRGGQLSKKDTIRPLVPLPASMGYWYATKSGGKMFKSSKVLTRAEVRRKSVVRVTKGIKFFNKAEKKWDYIPYTGKADKSKKIFKIPHPGTAKDGWTRSMRAFDEKKRSYDSIQNRKIRGINKAKMSTAMLLAEAVNRVKYVSKTSSSSARYGLNKATNRIWKTQSKKIDKAIERKFNRPVTI